VPERGFWALQAADGASRRRRCGASGSVVEHLSERLQSRWVRIAAWFLAISYGVGAPATAIAEIRSAALSARFGLPPELIYLTCALQLVSAPALLVQRWAPWAALALTLVTLGAIGTHLTTESPIRAIPAVVYAGVQVWFGIKSRGARGRSQAA